MRLALSLLVCGVVFAAPDRDAQFRALADRYFDEVYFAFNPTSGTGAGFHQYDPQLEDYTRAGIERYIAALQRFRAELDSFGRGGLSPATAADYLLVLSNIRGNLLTMESIRPWESNPDFYTSNATASVYVIMSRTYAPAPQRLESVVARERKIPAMFAAARANLRAPPRIYTEIALEQLPGMISFFSNDVPAAFKGAIAPEFTAANNAVIAALRDYEKFLRTDLLPKSNGEFRIGAERYRQKLLHDEMVDVPLQRLIAQGYDDLHRNQAEFKRIAGQIDPKRTPRQILDELENDHPAPGALLDTFRATFDGLISFIRDRHIVTLPSPVKPILQETPPFMRALTFASMDTPGPYERVSKEAFFNVTLPESNWPKERTEQHMQGFNRGTILSTAIHEAYPGHYTQFLWAADAPSKVRKLLAAGSNAEGWAHYCEQMMLDEGYSGGDLKLRLGQLQDALLRDARYLVGILMHTGSMTYPQAIDFFVKEGYQSRANAERESKRGTSDPTYLVYTLGKLEIIRLREDYKKKLGSAFRLQEFHDRFLSQGPIPIPLIRRALLGE